MGWDRYWQFISDETCWSQVIKSLMAALIRLFSMAIFIGPLARLVLVRLLNSWRRLILDALVDLLLPCQPPLRYSPLQP